MCRPRIPAIELPLPQGDKLCPFTIRQINPRTYLIKENDEFGEYPHIYARICSLSQKSSTSAADSQPSSVLVVTDTGVGTSVPNFNDLHSEPTTWTICSFLEYTINPGHRMPYLVMISHCHYDHILGLRRFLDEVQTMARHTNQGQQIPSLTILSSACAPSFLQPWSTLERNSLCIEDRLIAPHYNIDIWASDKEQIHFPSPSGAEVPLPITTLYTPGHTPDSLTWYDHTYRTLYVGDHVYYRESLDSINAPWGRESASPIIFCLQSDVADWFMSVDKLLAFVQQQNRDDTDDVENTGLQCVKLSAGHATVDVDAEKCLRAAKAFMIRVLRKEVRQVPLPNFQGVPRAHWKNLDADDPSLPGLNAISVIGSICVIEAGRKKLLPLLMKGGPLELEPESELELKPRIRDESIRESSKLRMKIVMRTKG